MFLVGWKLNTQIRRSPAGVRPTGPPLHEAPSGMGGVLDDREMGFPSDIEDLVHPAWSRRSARGRSPSFAAAA
jgi:hypothetical protein